MTYYFDYHPDNEVWYCLVTTTMPTFRSDAWPEGIWSKWGRKYRTRRRAEQAFSYVDPYLASSGWVTKIVPCGPPISQQERIRLGINWAQPRPNPFSHD
jgi:hypothetical protein